MCETVEEEQNDWIQVHTIQLDELRQLFRMKFPRESGFKTMNVDELKEIYVKSPEYEENLMMRVEEVRIGIFLIINPCLHPNNEIIIYFNNIY